MHQTKPICIGLLDHLLNQQEPITIESLVISLRMTPGRIQDELDVLRQYGCRFNIHPQHGIKLFESGLGVWSDYLESESSILRDVLVYGETGSTQDICKDICESPSKKPTKTDNLIVLTHHQNNGRGRLGRQWFAPPGKTISLSMIKTIQNQSDTEAINRLTLATSLAVAHTVDHFLTDTPFNAQIKWPNDIWVDNKKIAGILIETVRSNNIDYAIIGIGLNVSLSKTDISNTQLDGPKYTPTSLQICGISVDRLPVLQVLINNLDHLIKNTNDQNLLDLWRSKCLQFKHHIKLQSNDKIVEGEVVDIDPALGLIVRNNRGMLVHMPAASTTVL